MKCVNCPYHSRLFGQDWCDILNVPKRISEVDVTKDVPCAKCERKQLKEQKNDK